MNSLISKFMAVWLHPWQAMENVKTQGYQENVGFFANIKPSMLFVFVMGLVSGIISAIGITLHPPVGPQPTKAMIALTVLLIPIISSFIASFFFWLVVNGILKGRVSEYGLTYHVVALITAFSPLAALLSLIPGTLFLGLTVGGILAGLVNIWAAV